MDPPNRTAASGTEGTSENVARTAICKVTCALLCSVPSDALNVIGKVPCDADEAAENVIVCPAVVSVNGETGETLTPEGRPVTSTVTVPLNPLSDWSESWTVTEPPG